jgi:CBS-domain-containing membrane protein
MAPGCRVLDAHNPPPVRADSPALEVMTDLARIPVATIAPDDLISDANQAMLLRGVRLLPVTDEEGAIYGVLTTADFLSAKPLIVGQRLGVMRHELQVKDVMTPLDKIEVLRLAEVAHAHVGNIIATLKAVTRVHALVVDEIDGRQCLRGIFSASQIARQLGIHLVGHDAAHIFAEIDAAIFGSHRAIDEATAMLSPQPGLGHSSY